MTIKPNWYELQPCYLCNATGLIKVESELHKNVYTEQNCPICNGEGEIRIIVK